MDKLDYIKICRKDLHPRGSDIIMASVNSLIPIVNIPKKAFRLGPCDNSDHGFIANNFSWDYQCYSLEDVRETIIDSFPDIISIYDNLKTDQERINIGSYVYQYLYGGVYLAPNVEVTRSIDELFYSDSEVYLTPSPSYPNAYTNAFMASKPKSQFWLDVLSEIKKLSYSKPFWVIGNHLRSNIFTGSGALTTGARNTSIPFMILPSSLVSANSCCDLTKTDRRTYIRLTPTNESWDGYVLNYCWCKSDWIPYLIIGLFIILLIFIIFRSRTRYEWVVPKTQYYHHREYNSPPYIYPNW